MATITDCPDHSIGKLQHDHSAIHIARLSDFRAVQNASLDKNLFHFAANQETCHIEVMDGHIQENAAGALDISDGRRLRITADDMQHTWLAYLSLLHCLANTSIIGIKTP